jgi:hypothetical protein
VLKAYGGKLTSFFRSITIFFDHPYHFVASLMVILSALIGLPGGHGISIADQ